MVDDEPLLILPLVHHLVEERVHGFFPTVAANVAAADDDLGFAAFRGGTIVTEAAAHPA